MVQRMRNSVAGPGASGRAWQVFRHRAKDMNELERMIRMKEQDQVLEVCKEWY